MARTRQTARRSTGGRAPRRSFRGGRGRGRGRGGFRRGRGRGRGRGGGRGGRRSRAGKAKAVQAVGGERIHGSQLVLLTLQQSLDPEFVFQQTRDEATGDGEQQQHEDVSSGVAAASTSSSAVARRGLSTANSRGVLISQVMRESRTQHLTAGLSQFVRGQEAPIVLARLGRELAALGMSADVSFQTLSAKRSVLLARMYEAYEEQWREKKMSGSRRSARGSGRSLHKMAEIGITSGVHTMLMLVQHSAQTDMALCLNLLDFLADKLRAVPAMAFAADSSLPAPAVSAEIFEAVHETLVRVAGNAATPEPVRARTLQLLLLAATLRGSLSYFLSVIKLLLARSSDAGQGGLLSVLDTLHKLHRSTPKATIGAPVAAEHEATITASEVGSNPALVVQGRARVEPVLATDGCYLYEYSSRGLFKIGTGLEGSMPGVVYARIPCFRAGDQNVSLVACGGYLFYRSDNIGQNLMLVLDCRYLTEIGGVKSDGSGTFASADLSHLADFVSPDHETAFDAQQVEQVEDEGVSPEAHLAELQAQLAAMDDELFQYENMGNYQLAENLRMERMLLEEEVQTLEYELTGSISQRNSVPHAAHSFNFAPDPFGHQQGLGGWGATSAAHASTSAIPAVPTPAAAPSTPATKSAANDRIGQLLSDGRFLFAMVPFKPDGVDASTSADAGNAGPAAELTTALQQAVSSGVMTEQEARTMMDGQSLDDVAGDQASASDAALRRGYRVHAFDPESQLEHCHSVQLSCPNAGKRSQVVLDMSCEHLSDTKSKKKGKKKKSRKMRHRKGKGRHGQAAFQAVAKTSSAAHQRITGSFTFEVWARSQLDMTQNYNGQAIFQFGDSNQCITAGINADGLSLGARGNRGNLHMFVQPTLDLSDWTHLAFTFDADEQTWTIYVNGREVEQSPSNFPLDHPTPCWFFGAGPDFGESFRGQLADIRIWTAARTAEQIAADMASPIANVEAAETEGLVAYYPCDDGIGLTLRDLTSHKHPAQLTYCAWAETGRPVESLAAEAGATAEPILLHHEAVQDSLVYTNGECLAILYRYDVAGKAFPGFTDMRQRDAAVLQIFSLSSGELISESEISCEHLTSACVSPSSTSMWAAMGTEAGVYDRYRCAPPSATSRWRLERLDTGNESGFPTTIELLKRFPLPGSADLDQAGQSANAATTATGAAAAAQQPIDEDLLAETPAPDLESDAGDDDEDDESGSDSDSSDSAPDHHAVLALEDDPNAVPIHIAVVHILARLSQDCEARFQPQSSGSPPASLCLPLAVELSKHTFRELLNLTELLSKDYYAADLAKYGDLAEVRLFGFLVCLRLLRVNMLHLAAWNVDPVACGFGDDAKQQKKPKGKKKRKKDRTMQGRYVRLLNKLITKPPTSKLSALVATRVTSEVCESLSVGMPVFYASPHDRVAILSNLIKTATAASEDPQLAASDAVVMQLQLMDRYFEELSLPHNVVTLVPALVSLYASSKASGPHFLEQILQLTLRSTEAQARQTLEQEHDEDEDDDDEAKAPDNDDGDDAPVNLPAAPASRDKQARRVALLRDFLSRVQLCLLTSATRDMARARAEDVERRNAPGANTPATPTDDKKKDAQAAGKEAASAHRKRKMRERAQNAFDFSVHYAMHAIVSCTRLVRYVEKRFEALEAEPESMSRQLRLDAARVFVSTQLKDSVGALLLPLLSSLVAMELPAHTVSTMLPVLFRLMRSLHALCTRLPDVVAKENDFVEGKLQRVVVSRTVSVQSAHPVSQGVTERTLTIPGAKEMVLQIDPKTFQQQGQGSSLTLYRRPGQQDPIENGSFSTPHSQPIHIQGDSVTIVYNIGYLQSAWGFAVTGRALVEEARVELPWLLDLTKTVTLMASRCAARLVRGDFAADVDELDSSGKPVEAKAQSPGQLLHDPSESSNRKYLENDFFQFGLEFDEQVDAAERALLSWLPEDLAADPDDPVELPAGTPAHGAMPFLQRQVSYDGVELPALGLELAAKLRASPHARVAGFPVPEEVQPLVDRAIAAAVAVLVKHNMLTRESQRYIEAAEADPSAEPNDGLVRVWRSAHRLRRWLLQRYQKMRSQESEESAKNDEQADKADDAEASGDKADKPDDEEPKPEPKLRSRLEIYQELCDLVVDRCRFLLEVVPVPNAWSDTLAAGAPQLARQATSSGGKPIEMTDEQKVLLAWQSTKESVELKYASPEERYGLVWRHVLQFFDNTSIDVQSLHRSITVRRLRARVKSCGLRAFRQLLDAVSMCNMRRDIIGELVPALCLNDKEAFSGLAPDVMEGLAACGPQLTGDLQRSMHAVYGILTDILSNPKQSGPHLLQAALHAFSLDYDREEFNLVVSLGIFPALHKLLLEDEEDQFAGDDDALLEEEEYDEEQQEEDEDEAEVERELRKGFKTSAWALLNMLTTTILSNQGLNPNALDDSDAASSSRKSKIEPIYVILEAQLARIAQQLEDKHVRSLDEEYVPSLSGPALLGGSLGDATEAGAGVDANSRAVAMKVATVSSFGMETSQTGLGEGGQLQDGSAQGNADQALFGDAFHVKVLNLVESICHLTEGRARIVRKAPGSDASPLSSLLRILHTGSPRARLVVLRILRSLLTSPESPALEELDADLVACLQQLARDTATVQPQADNFVRHFLSLIGRANTAPVFAALSLDSVSQSPEVREVLRSINATNLHSADGIHLPSEAVMFVRFLARSRRSEWAQAVQDVVVPLLDSLPTLTEKLNTMQRGLAALEAEAARVAAASGASAPSADPTARQRSELTRQLAVDSEFWASFWPALGALCVCGGFVSTLEVGARVRYTPDGTTGTIVSRSPERGMLQYIRDGEGSVNEVDAKDVVCCGDVPLDVPVLLGDTSRVTGLLTSLTSLLGVLDIRKGAAALRGQADVPASSAAATSSGKSAAPAKRDPTALELLAAELHARAARALFALLQQDVSYVQAFVDDPEKLRVVQALATEASPSVRGTTAAIEDLVSALGHEASKRAKIQSTIEVTLKLGRGSGSTLEIARPEADFKLEQTWVGGKLGDQHTSGGPKLSTVFEPADGAGSDDEDEAKAAEDGDGDGDAAAPPSDGFGFGSGSADGPPTGGFGFAGGAGGPGGFDSASGAGDPKSGGFGFAGGAGGPASGGFGSAGAAGGPKSGGFGFPGGKGLGKGGKGGKGLGKGGKGDKAGKGGKGGKGVASAQSPEEEFPGAPAELLKKLKAVDGAGGDAAAAKQLRKQLSGYASKSSQQAAGDNDADGADEFSFGGNDAGGQEKLAFGAGGAGSAGAQPMSFGASGAFGNPGSGDAPPTPMTAPVASGNFLDTASAAGASGWRNPSPSNPAFGNPPAGMHAPAMAMGGMSTMATPAMAMGGAPTGWGGMSGGQHLMQQQMQQQMQQMQPQQHMQPQQQMQPAPAPAPKAKVAPKATKVRLSGPAVGKTSVRGELSYLRLNKAPSEEVCRGKVVVLDSYGFFEQRAAKCVELGAEAVVLALHSANGRFEGLDEVTEADLAGANAGAKTEEVEEQGILEQARARAIRTAIASAGGGPMAAPEEDIEDDVDLPGKEEAGPSDSVEEWRRAFDAAQRAAADGKIGVVDPAAAKLAESIAASFMPAEQVSALLNRVPVYCCNDSTALVLRRLCGARESDDPARLNCDILDEQLVQMGFPAKHTRRALEKNGWKIGKAAEWLAENAEWLAEQEEMMDMLNLGKGGKTTAPQVAKKSSRKSKARPAKSDSFELLDVGDASFDDVEPASDAQSASGKAEPKAGGLDWSLESTWAEFGQSNSFSISGSEAQPSSTLSASVAAGLPLASTYAILEHAMRAQASVVVHYARRALVSLFARWPRDKSLAQFGSPKALVQTLHVALEQEPHHAVLGEDAEDAEAILSRDFRRTLLRALLDDKARDSSLLADTILADCEKQLKQATEDPSLDEDEAEEVAGSAAPRPRPKARLSVRRPAGRVPLPDSSSSEESECEEEIRIMGEPATSSATAPAAAAALGEASEMRSLPKPIVVPVNGRPHEWFPIEKLSVRGAKWLNIKVKLKIDMSRVFGGEIMVSFYSSSDGDPNSVVSQVMLYEQPNMISSEEVLVNAGTVWYSVTSNNWYEGHHAATKAELEVSYMCPPGADQGDVIHGSLSSTLVFMDVLMCSLQPGLVELLLLLLRALPSIEERQLAQQCCRTAARLFNHWDKLVEVEDPAVVQACAPEIAQIVELLEQTHTSLRSSTLLDWARATIPGPHLQTLLELVLAARAAFPRQPKTDADGDDPLADVDPRVVEAFAKHRDGPVHVSLIHLQRRQLSKEMHLVVGPNCYNGVTYIGDVCVKRGRWYWELKLETRPSYVAVGWVTRDFTPANAINNDSMGFTWSAVGPNNAFMHRGMDVVGGSNHHGGLFGGGGPARSSNHAALKVARWEPDTVIGVLVDIDAKEMSFTFNGNNTTTVFSGFDVGDGLYPALSCGQSTSVRVNFGAEPFAHPPPPELSCATPASGDPSSAGHGDDGAEAPMPWAPLQHSDIVESSWLDRYRHASQVTQLVYERKDLPPDVVDASLSQEVSLTADSDADFHFECVSIDGSDTAKRRGAAAGGALGNWNVPGGAGGGGLFSNQNNWGASPFGGLGSSGNAMRDVDRVLQDDRSVFTHGGASPSHLTFKVSGPDDTPFYLRELVVRVPFSNNNSYGHSGWGGKAVRKMASGSGASVSGMVFLSEKKPEVDSFEWCNEFRREHFEQFIQRKQSMGQEFRAHEPLAFFQFKQGETTQTVQIELPPRAVYVTVKFIYSDALQLEYLGFRCIHGEHPLGHLIGTPLAEAKSQDLLAELKEGVHASLSADWDVAKDEELVTMLQTISQRLGVSPMSLSAVMLRPDDGDLTRFKELEHAPLNAMRARFGLIKYLNRLVTPLLHYVDVSLYESEMKMGEELRLASLRRRRLLRAQEDEDGVLVEEEEEEDEAKADDDDDDDQADDAVLAAAQTEADREAEVDDLLMANERSLSFVVHKLKGLYFMSTKKSVFDMLLAEGAPRNPTVPRISVNRIKAARSRDNRAGDPDGLNSTFGQIFTQLRGVPYSQLRGQKDQQMWNVAFLGEGSVDVGGPYRESVTNMCADLMSDSTPLFVHAPNGVNDVGLNRDKWVINPSARSSVHLAMFEFIGALMGMALRTKLPLSLDLPSLFWKKLLDESVDISDLEGVDKLCVQALGEISSLEKAKFDYLVDEHFTTQLSDHSVVELKENGQDLPVTFEARKEFVELVIQARLRESDKQLHAVRKGLDAVVPVRMLSLFSWYDLEVMVCGNPVIDIEDLRRHTNYNGYSSTHSVIKNLFKALHSFNNEERQMFLRFVWGRNRLPSSASDWSTNFTVNRLNSSKPDEVLVLGHCCFFSLDLPTYSTYEILRSKLLYAITNCVAVDVDFNPTASSLAAWIDVD